MSFEGYDDLNREACNALIEHELKTPLTSMRSAAEILRDNQDLSAEDRSRFLDVLIEDNSRLEGFVIQILSLLAAHPDPATKLAECPQRQLA